MRDSLLTEMRDFYLQGLQDERERIINLLESLNCPANGIEHDCNNDLGDYTPSDLIALIKGEQSE